MTITAAYLRDSGGEAQELSIIQQEQQVRDWCAENGHQLRTIFKDEARPGSSTVGREAFQSMINHLSEGKPEESMLVVWSFSRFARDLNDAMFYKAMLRKNSIEVVSITDDLPEDPKFSRLIEFMLDFNNELFLDNLSKDVKRGLKHILLEHGGRPGTPPKGFMREAVIIGEHRGGKPHTVSRWVPDPAWWDACERAWRMRLDGASLRRIHQDTGLFRAYSSYTSFFRNPIYKGSLEYGDITIENYYPAIVSTDDWNRIQIEGKKRQHLNNPRKQAARKNSRYLLSGLVFCAECGAPLNGKTVQFKDKQKHPYRYYECSQKQRSGKTACDMPKISAPVLEQTVLMALQDELSQPNRILELIEQHQNRSTKAVAEEKETLTQQLTQTRQQIETTADLVIKTGSSTLAERLLEMEHQEKALKNKLSALRIDPGGANQENIHDFCLKLAENLSKVPKPELRAILANLIDEIRVKRIGKHIYGQMTITAPQPVPGEDLCLHVASPWSYCHIDINFETTQ